jgi:hypothetical protein
MPCVVHLQYTTGIFYGFVAMSGWSMLFVVASVPIFLFSLVVCRPLGGPLPLRLALPFVAGSAGWLFGKHSLATLEDLSKETLLALGLKDVRRELAELSQGLSEEGEGAQ